MYFINYGMLAIPITIAIASFSLRRPGWLDKLVAYHKNRLFEDFQKLPTIQIKATIEPAPPGYVDSKEWNFDSVLRLLTLIRESETAQPVRRALGKMLNYRRMGYQESLKLFPSLAKEEPNNFYYDIDSGEYYGDLVTEPAFPGDEPIIVVSNPVEARLPSAMISVSLLREILEARAIEARRMPATPSKNSWKPRASSTTDALAKNVTTTAAGGKTGSSSSGSTIDSSKITGSPDSGSTVDPAETKVTSGGESSKDTGADTTTIATN